LNSTKKSSSIIDENLPSVTNNTSLKVPTEIKHQHSKLAKLTTTNTTAKKNNEDTADSIHHQNSKSYNSDSFESTTTAVTIGKQKSKTAAIKTLNKSNTNTTNNDDSSIKTQLGLENTNNNKYDEFSTIAENLNESEKTLNNETSSGSISESEVSSSIATNTTINTANDLEFKVKALKDELIKKKQEAEKLRQSLKIKEKSKLKEKEEFLRKKINSYDSLIDKIKVALDKPQPSSTSPTLPQEIADKTTPKKKNQPPASTTTATTRQQKQKQSRDKTESIQEEIFQTEDNDVTSSSSSTSHQSTSVDDDAPIRNFNVPQSPVIASNQVGPHKNNDDLSSTSSSSSSSSSSSKSVSRNTHSSLKSKREDKKSPPVTSVPASVENNQYDEDDFDAPTTSINTKSKSSTTNSSTDKKKMTIPLSTLKPNKDLDLKQSATDLIEAESSSSKSSASEISEEVLPPTTKQRKDEKSKSTEEASMVKSSIKNLDLTSDESSSESTDTQILLLGSSRKSTAPAVLSNITTVVPVATVEALDPVKSEISTRVHDDDHEPVGQELDDSLKIDTDSIEGDTNYQEDLKNNLGDDHNDDNDDSSSLYQQRSVQSEHVVEKIQSVLIEQNIHQMLHIRQQKLDKVFYASAEQQQQQQHQEEEYLEKSHSKILIPVIDFDLTSSDDQKRLKESKELTFKEPIMNVPFDKEKIGRLCDLALEDYFWSQLGKRSNLVNLNQDDSQERLAEPALKLFFEPESDGPEKTNEILDMELTFKHMLLDLIGELMNDLYLETYDKPQQISEFIPGIKTTLKKQYFRSNPHGPTNLTQTKSLIKEKIFNIFKFKNGGDHHKGGHHTDKSVKSKWRCQKPLDLVDGLLDAEMREQEHDWSTYDQEEHEAKLLIANTVFDIILKDTIDCFQVNFLKKQSL
jgi:hypothetical protein